MLFWHCLIKQKEIWMEVIMDMDMDMDSMRINNAILIKTNCITNYCYYFVLFVFS